VLLPAPAAISTTADQQLHWDWSSCWQQIAGCLQKMQMLHSMLLTNTCHRGGLVAVAWCQSSTAEFASGINRTAVVASD